MTPTVDRGPTVQGLPIVNACHVKYVSTFAVRLYQLLLQLHKEVDSVTLTNINYGGCEFANILSLF